MHFLVGQVFCFVLGPNTELFHKVGPEPIVINGVSYNPFYTAENKCVTGVTPPKTNMTVENPPFEDVFPIENRNFPMSC